MYQLFYLFIKYYNILITFDEKYDTLHLMFEKLTTNPNLTKEQNVKLFCHEAIKLLKSLCHNDIKKLDICDYKYDTSEAVSELGLESELIEQLVEDYVIQVLKTQVSFLEQLQCCDEAKEKNNFFDLKIFRELAHKNLGVARNLRIRDGEKLLYAMMKSDDLEYLKVCLQALELVTIRLKPRCAYDTFKLMEVKSAL